MEQGMFEFNYSLPSGHGLETEVESSLHSLGAIPERGTDAEVALALRAAAIRFRAMARAFEAVAAEMEEDDAA